MTQPVEPAAAPPSPPSASSSAARSGRRGRGGAAGTLVLLAGVTALVVVPTWLTASGSTALRGTVTLAVAGTQVAPAVLGASVVLLASAAAVALVGRVGRWLVAVVTALSGVLVVGSAAAVLADPRAAVVPVVTQQTGVGKVVGDVGVTAWPWLTVVAGVLVVVAAGWLVRVSRGWQGPSRRHETPAAGSGPAGPAGPVDERGAWDALSRGDDPT
ncbi:Trp biosynthesis-associated membrane protein [Cellulomonas biazotea]|uniref:Trp biosynthesis-associated membrane protein n=2 Tax=Cellulomonas biazotea TaxID=1709 RepID=UPI0035EC30E2